MNGMMVAKNVFNIDVLIDTMMTRLFHLAEYVINHYALTACVPAAHAATAVAACVPAAPSATALAPVAISTPSGESPAEPSATVSATPVAPVAEQVFAPSLPLSNARKGKMVEGDLFQNNI